MSKETIDPKKKREEFIRKVKSVFGTKEGEEVYKELMAKYYDRRGFVKGMDAIELAHREGQRSVMYSIKKFVEKKLD